jgi:hypothetical protein
MDVLREIERLDPVADAARICQLSTAYHFPFDSNIALELALFRTFCVPTIAALLDATGEFEERAQKRYDDTVLLISEFVENGLDSERGRRALARMNAIHGCFDILNDDYLYVLSTFVVEPLRWNERFGWRPLIEKERQASFHLWLEIGRRMGIRDLPASLAEMDAFNVAYERRHFAFSDASRRVGEATLRLFVRRYPRPVQPLVRFAIHSFLDEPMRRAFGFPAGHPFMRRTVEIGLRSSAMVRRWLPKRRRPLLRSRLAYPSYPAGHVIEELGSHAAAKPRVRG